MAVIDVWMQHSTLRFLRHDMFDSLRRWTGQSVPDEELPIDLTVAAMGDAGVDRGLISATGSSAASPRPTWTSRTCGTPPTGTAPARD